MIGWWRGQSSFVMVWGCMFRDGPGYACKIDGRMDGDLYVKIMEEDLKASMDYYGKSPEQWSFSKIMTQAYL